MDDFFSRKNVDTSVNKGEVPDIFCLLVTVVEGREKEVVVSKVIVFHE